MFGLLLIAVSGCWSQKLHDLEVWVDDPGAVRVGVVADEGGAAVVAIEPGAGDATGSVDVLGRTIALGRTSAGLRVSCDTCGPTQLLVGSDGRFIGLYQRDEIDLVLGEPVLARRPYDLARVADRGARVTLEMGADWDRVTRVEAMQGPLRSVGWVAFSLGLTGLIPGLLLLGEEQWVAGSALLGGSVALLSFGGTLAFHQRRAVLVWEPGDPRFDPRPIGD